MFSRLWRRWQVPNPRPSGAKCSPGGRRPTFRPHLDPLEDRLLPALLTGPLIVPPAAPPAVGSPNLTTGLNPVSPTPPPQAALPTQIEITVPANAPDKVIDLESLVADWEGVRHGDTPRLSIIRNTNRDLVTAELSRTELTLTFARGETGSATVTVGVKDASGASMQIAFAISVQGPASAPPVPLPGVAIASLAIPVPGMGLPGR